MFDFINNGTLVLTALTTVASIVILLLYFFKKETILKSIGCNSPEAVLISITVFFMSITLHIFGHFYTKKSGVFSVGTATLGFMLCFSTAMYILYMIVEWRSKIEKT